MRAYCLVTLAKTRDLPIVLDQLKGGKPDRLLTLLGESTQSFFRAYEVSGWRVPINGRIDFAKALGAVSPDFRAHGGPT